MISAKRGFNLDFYLHTNTENFSFKDYSSYYFLGKLNRKPYFNPRTPLSIRVRENTSIGFVLSDVISTLATDDEGDPLHYELDEAGQEVCTIGYNDGRLRLKIRPDREVSINYVRIYFSQNATETPTSFPWLFNFLMFYCCQGWTSKS